MSDDNKTYDLTITLDEKAMRLWANTVARQSIPVRAAARAKLAEIDAERAATTPPVISLEVADWPKMIRETLCVAQTVGGIRTQDSRHREHIDRIQRLIDACDVHRPLGPDGKHGNLHTPTCGCEIDAERAAAVKATERRTFAVYECDAEDNRRSVFASDLAVGDRVEGRTVSDPMDADGYVWFNDGGTGWQYGPGSLVLLDGEGS